MQFQIFSLDWKTKNQQTMVEQELVERKSLSMDVSDVLAWLNDAKSKVGRTESVSLDLTEVEELISRRKVIAYLLGKCNKVIACQWFSSNKIKTFLRIIYHLNSSSVQVIC